jgi:hypothetical protein
LKKIIVIDGKWDMQSPAIQYAMMASRGADTEITGIFLTDDGSREKTEKAEAVLQKVKQECASQGVGFHSLVAAPEAQSFLNKIEALMPASLVIIGDVKFSQEMIKGGASLEALRERLSCPVTTAESLVSARHREEKPARGINWGKWLMYAIGSALMYFVFFPKVKMLNEKLFMTETVLGAIAIMAVVIVHAWIWGNTTHILPKLFKLEK